MIEWIVALSTAFFIASVYFYCTYRHVRMER